MEQSPATESLNHSVAEGSEIIVVQGRRLTARQAQKLEQSLRKDPDNLRARLLLLGYYWARQSRDKGLVNAIARHLLWLMENSPGSGVLEYPFFYNDSTAFRKVKRRWSEAVKQHPNDLVYLRRAASSCSLVDPRTSLSYLKRAQKLEPENEDWPQQISHLYMHTCIHGPANPAQHSDMQSVRSALRAGRQALQLHKNFPRPSYLEKNMEMTVSRLAETAFRFGLFEEALYFGKYLIERYDQFDERGNHSAELRHKRRFEGHMGHAICGRVALNQGNIEAARVHLSLMAQLGDPDWRHDLTLAGALLKANEKEVVLIYLKRCAMNLKERLLELERDPLGRRGMRATVLPHKSVRGRNADATKMLKQHTTNRLIRINEWSTAIRSGRKPKLPEFI